MNPDAAREAVPTVPGRAVLGNGFTYPDQRGLSAAPGPVPWSMWVITGPTPGAKPVVTGLAAGPYGLYRKTLLTRREHRASPGEEWRVASRRAAMLHTLGNALVRNLHLDRRNGIGGWCRMTEPVPAYDRSVTYAGSAGNLARDDLGVKVTAAFAIRFPRGRTLPGTTYKVGRWGDVGHFAPIGRSEVALLSAGTLDGLTTLCRISFTFADVERIAGEQVFRTVVCDRCLVALRTLPELLLL
jgi:hypothetical protein